MDTISGDLEKDAGSLMEHTEPNIEWFREVWNSLVFPTCQTTECLLVISDFEKISFSEQRVTLIIT